MCELDAHALDEFVTAGFLEYVPQRSAHRYFGTLRELTIGADPRYGQVLTLTWEHRCFGTLRHDLRVKPSWITSQSGETTVVPLGAYRYLAGDTGAVLLPHITGSFPTLEFFRAEHLLEHHPAYFRSSPRAAAPAHG